MCGAECGGGEGARRPSGAQGRPDHCVSSSITRADAKGGRWRTCGHLGAPARSIRNKCTRSGYSDSTDRS